MKRILPVVSALLVATATLVGVPAAGSAVPATTAATPAGTVAATTGSTTSAAPSVRRATRRVATRSVTFSVVNTAGLLDSLGCAVQPDGRERVVRARLVGPADVVAGRGGSETFHLLVHDAGTGGWFWNLRDHPAHDYATQLARRGETSVVLDRLGYDRSPLRGGETCLPAQAEMLHSIVQKLYSGTYTSPRRGSIPHASHVVVHGHGTGATIARLEAAEHSDVQALVLMSPASTSPSALALRTLRDQSARCLRGASSAPYGVRDREFRRLLFASAPAAVQRAAVERRNNTPCGDVASLASAVLMDRAEQVDVPTLVLTGRADARRDGSVSASSTARVVRRSYAGAGSALPLERQAPAVRRAVLAFVGSLDDRVR